MYVCFCKGIRDSDIRNAVAQGANSFSDVQKQLGIATQCGNCRCLTNTIVTDALENANSPATGLFYSVA